MSASTRQEARGLGGLYNKQIPNGLLKLPCMWKKKKPGRIKSARKRTYAQKDMPPSKMKSLENESFLQRKSMFDLILNSKISILSNQEIKDLEAPNIQNVWYYRNL